MTRFQVAAIQKSLGEMKVSTTGSSCRGPEFMPQHPYGGSKPQVTQVPGGDPKPSSGLHRCQAVM